MTGRKNKSPINRSILIGCAGLIIVLGLLLSLQTRAMFSRALYDQYKTRLREVVTAVENCVDADDLRECIRSGTSSPQRDELQQLINRFVDDFDLGFLYIAIPQDTPDGGMLSVVASTSQAERVSGDTEDWPILYDCSSEFTREQVQPYLEAWNSPDVSYFTGDSEFGMCHTGCKPLKTSDGETIALICADYYVDDVAETVSNYVVQSVVLIVLACMLFGVLLALWLRRNVTRPIRALEQSALRFAKVSQDSSSAADISMDVANMAASSEVGMLIEAMTKLSQEMKVQAEGAALMKAYAKEMEDENQRLSEQADAVIKIANLTQSVTSLMTNIPGMTSSKDAKTGKYLVCNQMFAEFLGFKSPDEVIGRSDEELFDAGLAVRFAADDRKAMSMDQPYNFNEELRDAAGKMRKFQTTKLKFTDDLGRLCLLCMRLDYTELTRFREETAQAKAAYEKALSASALYASIAQALSANYASLFYINLDSGNYIAYRSRPNEDPEETRGADFFGEKAVLVMQGVHEEDGPALEEALTQESIRRVLGEREMFTLTYRVATGDETYAYSIMRVIRMQGDSSHIMIGIANNEDVDAHNELTGLRTEAALLARGTELLRAHPEGWCVLAIDLEHFRLFNEWYGESAGNDLLAHIGQRLIRVETMTGGLACYLGQDDFALVVPYEEEKIKKLFASIQQFAAEQGDSKGFTPAFGICLADAEASVEELYDNAAQAVYHAKENYQNRIRVFAAGEDQNTEEDYQILSEFRQALQSGEVFFQLQPQYEIESGKIIGAETLARWQKADGTMVPPGTLVPILEQYGFVTDLDQFVWEGVCAWLRRWIDSGHKPVPVSVNISQIDFFTIDVPAFLAELLNRYGLPAELLRVEIAESVYVSNGTVAEAVEQLRSSGVRVLMDDFGNGYASISMLHNLNVDVIKLDAQFLRDNAEDSKGIYVLKTIVNMAKSMKMPVLVECLETEQELEFATGIGCRCAQGYYFNLPMSVPEFEALIGDEDKIDTAGLFN